MRKYEECNGIQEFDVIKGNSVDLRLKVCQTVGEIKIDYHYGNAIKNGVLEVVPATIIHPMINRIEDNIVIFLFIHLLY